jgi:hypothetical protein
MLKKLFIFSIIFNTNLVISQDVTYDCNEFEILTDGTVNIILGSATPISSTGGTGTGGTGDTGTGNVLDIVGDLGCVVFDDGDPNTTDYKTSDVKCQRGVISNTGTFTGIFEYDRYPTDRDFTNDPNNISGYCYKGDIYIFAEVKCQDGTWASNGDWNGGLKYDPIVTSTGGSGSTGGSWNTGGSGGTDMIGGGESRTYINIVPGSIERNYMDENGCLIGDGYTPETNECFSHFGYLGGEPYTPYPGTTEEEYKANYNPDGCLIGYYYHPQLAALTNGYYTNPCVPNGTPTEINFPSVTSYNGYIEKDAHEMQVFCSPLIDRGPDGGQDKWCGNLSESQLNDISFMANLYCELQRSRNGTQCKSQDENGNLISDPIPNPGSGTQPVIPPVIPPENTGDLNEDYCDQNPGNTIICGEQIPTEPPPEEEPPEEPFDICEQYPNYAGCKEDKPYNPMDNPMYNVCINLGNSADYCASQF